MMRVGDITRLGRDSEVLQWIEHLSPPVAWASIVAVVVATGIADFASGADVGFTHLYLLPVALATWRLGRKPGHGVACLCAMGWLLTDMMEPAGPQSLVLHVWNLGVQLGVFNIVVLLLSALRSQLRRAEAMALTDALTGLPNRRGFHLMAERERRRAVRAGTPLTAAFIDLDHFKSMNDSYGHELGDEVLTVVANELATALRDVDVVGRLGGDEFAAILPSCGAAEGLRAMERVRAQLLNAMSKHGWPVTFSIGAVTCPRAPATLGPLVERADALMYLVKSEGKNAIKHELVHPKPVLVCVSPQV